MLRLLRDAIGIKLVAGALEILAALRPQSVLISVSSSIGLWNSGNEGGLAGIVWSRNLRRS